MCQLSKKTIHTPSLITIRTLQFNLVPRVFLRHTLITKPNEHPGTLRSHLPKKWANVEVEAIMDFTVG